MRFNAYFNFIKTRAGALTNLPTARQGGLHTQVWDVADTAIKRDAPAFAEFVEEAQ